MFAVVKLATLLIPSGTITRPGLKHLAILLTDPVGPAKQILIVTVSTLRGSKFDDRTCIINAGEHDFIKQQSYVVYSACRCDCFERHIHDGIANKMLSPMHLLREDVFTRVLAGVEKSPHTKPFAKKFLRDSN